MAASASDKAKKSYSYLQKTLNSGISDVATVLTPNNVTSIPTDTGVSFVVDRVDSSGNKTPTLRELMTGVVAGSTITGLLRGQQGTTAQAHLANAVIEFVNSGQMWNDLIDFLLQDHSNPNGNHKTLTDDNSNEWLERGSVASAVNQVKITNAITATAPIIAPSGDDTNIGLTINSKAAGDIKLTPGNSTGKVYVDGSVPKSYFALFNFVESGCVITADSVGVNKNYSMSSGVVWIGGKRLTVAAVAAQTVGASKDRYIDLSDNGDGTALITNTEVANNAASPAIPASGTDATNIRVGIVVAGATTIATTGSLNQGQVGCLLPIASSIPYMVTDSLGLLIFPTDPQRKLLGYKQSVTVQSGITAETDLTGLAVPVTVPAGRRIKIITNMNLDAGATDSYGAVSVKEGAAYLNLRKGAAPGPGYETIAFDTYTNPTAGLHTYKLAMQRAAGTSTMNTSNNTAAANTIGAGYIAVELA